MKLPKYYRMRDLRIAFKRAGLFDGDNPIYFTTKIRRLEDAGRLRVPRSVSGHRQFTLEQIAEIVAAFSPGGKGCYFYKKPSITQAEMNAIKDGVVQDSITKKIKEMEDSNGRPNKPNSGKVSGTKSQDEISKRVSALRKENRVRVQAYARNKGRHRTRKD